MQNQKTETKKTIEKTSSILKKREAEADLSEVEPEKKTQKSTQITASLQDKNINKRVKKQVSKQVEKIK